MKEITKEWLKSAESDLLIIEKIIDEEFLTHQVAFHSQQAIEKAFKAVLEEYEIPFKKTHSLETLSAKVTKKLNIQVNFEIIKILDQLYLGARYPGEFGLLPNGKPGLDDAEEFYEYSKLIFNTISDQLDP